MRQQHQSVLNRNWTCNLSISTDVLTVLLCYYTHTHPSILRVHTYVEYLICKICYERIVYLKIRERVRSMRIRMDFAPFCQYHKCASEVCHHIGIEVCVHSTQQHIIIFTSSSLKCLIRHFSFSTNIMIRPIWSNNIESSQIEETRKWRWPPVKEWSTEWDHSIGTNLWT